MARIARVVAPGVPHHVTQRGNRRQPVFFCDRDYSSYLALLKEWSEKGKLEIWAYCLLPNHVHLTVVPNRISSMASAIGETHRRYTRLTNLREDWLGYLWQGRFASYPMDDDYLLKALRYVELNPVRAGLVSRADEYQWSSARAHLTGAGDPLLQKNDLRKRVGDWTDFLGQDLPGGVARDLTCRE